jgi:hypothetical protein
VNIQIDPHTLERAEQRGASEEEIYDVVRNGSIVPAKYGRMAKAKVYPYNQRRNGKQYEHKRIEVIYTSESDMAVVTITVYVFYGKWEHDDANPL